MNYHCLKNREYQNLPYQLVAIRRDDLFLIKKWRNDQMNILRQKFPLSDEDQMRYWEEVIAPSFGEEEPRQILFSFLREGFCIGYGGLVHIDWGFQNAEVSFLLSTERVNNIDRYEKEFLIFLSFLKQVAFVDLDFHRLYTECYDLRPWHVKILEKFGFQEEGRLREHVKVEGEFVDSLIHGLLN